QRGDAAFAGTIISDAVNWEAFGKALGDDKLGGPGPAGAGRRRVGRPTGLRRAGTGGRRLPARTRGTGLRSGARRCLLRPEARRCRLLRPGLRMRWAVAGRGRPGGTRDRLADTWSNRPPRTGLRTGLRHRRTAPDGRRGRATDRRDRTPVRAELGTLLLRRTQVVDPAELLAGRLGRGVVAAPPPTPPTSLGARFTPLVGTVLRLLPTSRCHC
ncbi:hypothetical protein ABZ436_18130, partial [Micromonospora matsumotoense]|uniref:hypothetical protein n=1 Tax=Micromonospora matsumotoense TaxID=121616 RepID=UPI0033EF5B76